MSNTKTISKIETRMVIGFDDETKAEINALKGKLDKVAHAMSAKNESHGDRLLAAMQADAANDALQPEIKELGQWVFEGQDEKWVHARTDRYNKAFLYQDTPKIDATGAAYGCPYKCIGYGFLPNMAIDRETVNDVDYLSDDDLNDSVPHIDDVLAQPNWLSDSVPQITQADMQLIFIKNLSNVLIQRMHSMNRFSEDDYAIGGDKLMAWDIVIGNNSFNDKRPNFAIVIATSNIEHSDKSSFGIADLTSCFSLNQFIHTGQYVKISVWHNETYRTITEDELPAFREALEVCYV